MSEDFTIVFESSVTPISASIESDDLDVQDILGVRELVPGSQGDRYPYLTRWTDLSLAAEWRQYSEDTDEPQWFRPALVNVEDALSSERNDRESVDADLQAQILAEATTREENDGNLSGDITAAVDAMAAALAAAIADSRLNLGPGYSQASPGTFVQNVEHAMPWVVNASAGSDLSLDPDTMTIHFLTAGTYLLRLRWGMSTIIAGTKGVWFYCNVSGGGIAGGDSILSSVYLAGGDNPDPVTSWLWRVTAGATFVLGAKLFGGSGDEHGYDFTFDIARVR